MLLLSVIILTTQLFQSLASMTERSVAWELITLVVFEPPKI